MIHFLYTKRTARYLGKAANQQDPPWLKWIRSGG
jgi:hypothetical protein